MDCNKDEAIRAKEIAEQKFAANDIAGAKKLASKAQSLYPGLPGISQMLATLNVYNAVEKKINGESDWYEVLAVDPQADDETVRKQYRKLVLTLHPDKNKTTGAEGAFKLVSQAWGLLSDKSQRKAYDERRKPRGFQNISFSRGASSGTNGFSNSTRHTASNVRTDKKSTPNVSTGKTPNVRTAKNSTPNVRSGKNSTPNARTDKNSTPNARVDKNLTPNARADKNSTQANRFSTKAGSFVTQAGGSATRAGSPATKAGRPSTQAGSSSAKAGRSSTPVSSYKPKPSTFWTVCYGCRLQYEHFRVYLNQNLVCPCCHQPFLAVERAPPLYMSCTAPMTWKFSQQHQNSENQAGLRATGISNSNPFNRTSFHWFPFRGTSSTLDAAQAANVVQEAYEKVKREREEAQAATVAHEKMKREREEAFAASVAYGRMKRAGEETHAASLAKQASERMKREREEASAASSVKQACEKMKRECDEAHAAAKREDTLPRKRHNSKGTAGVSLAECTNPVSGMGASNFAVSSSCKQGNCETGWVDDKVNAVSLKTLSQIKMRNLLMEKARKEIREKLTEFSAKSMTRTVANSESKRKGEASGINGNSCDRKRSRASFPDMLGAHKDEETLEAMLMDVPDPDFHDFDKDRSENSFGENQIWALYDNDDKMPRIYAMIHNVISLNPFSVQISWLNSRSSSELGPLDWLGSGFTKTCGDFRVGKYQVHNSLNSFSHEVKWTKGARGVVHIYPKKGDVWALYRHWAPDWNEETPDEVIHKYDMVEVIEDYSEERGVAVAPLLKVAGFRTVFHRHLDPKEVKRIPREELFRFSHQVPAYLLTGQEAINAPKGCQELDPAATPMELLQAVLDVDKGKLVVDEENLKEQNEVSETAQGIDKGTDEERVNFNGIPEVETVEEPEPGKSNGENNAAENI